MKQLLMAIAGCCILFTASAQQELHIHHINVEDGDAIMIGIYDKASDKYTAKMLIDGGYSSADKMLLPYLNKMVSHSDEPVHFNYIVLTHFHNDHYNGLNALKKGKITADSLIDPGGYDFDEVFGGKKHAAGEEAPERLEMANTWISTLKTAASHSPAYIKDHSRVFVSYGTSTKSAIGKSLVLGKVGNNKVELRCVAGWGNTLSDHGVTPNPDPDKDNPNNYSLAFVLTCGEFRYFIGGDIGGSDDTQYIDQETILTGYLNKTFKNAYSWSHDSTSAGHICGIKANHHGSNNSNTSYFMESMHPAIVVTSAGQKDNWHLPGIDYLDRLSTVRPMSENATASTGDLANRGVYFTNLYNFTKGNTSLAHADQLFKNAVGVSYNYGNNTASSKASYLIKVTDAASLSTKSSFEVGRVDIDKATPYKKLATYKCHTK